MGKLINNVLLAINKACTVPQRALDCRPGLWWVKPGLWAQLSNCLCLELEYLW